MFNFIYTTEYITKKCLKDKEDLIFLDSVMYYLFSNKMSAKTFQNVLDNCNYPVQYYQKFTLVDSILKEDEVYRNWIYKSAIAKLIKDNLVEIDINNKYYLSYEGLVLNINGGLLQKQVSLKRKDLTQNLIWFIAFATFIINLVFQIFNSIFKC